MRKLILSPDTDSYSVTEGVDFIGTAFRDVAGRYRLDKLGSPKIIAAVWTLRQQEYAYWRAFYHTAIEKGVFPFLCDLIPEDGRNLVEHVCMMIPGSVKMPAQQGLAYVQQAMLEVLPLPHNAAADLAVIAAFEAAYG